MKLKWEPCVLQENSDFEAFLSQYLDHKARKALLIGGAGFDPRATYVPYLFSRLKNTQVQGIFFREERLLDQPKLRPCADQNERKIAELVSSCQFPKIDIFSDGVTAVGGRRAVEVIGKTNCSQFTDIFIDISALSCGVFFSIVFYLVEYCSVNLGAVINLHLLTVEQPQFDHSIRGVPSDNAAMLHGFKGLTSLDSSDSAALLWIPTLSPGNRNSLAKIYQHIQRTESPIDVCPIVPFPGADPRLPDKLVDEYRDLLATWRVDHRNILYAAESDPLDSYRAISSLCRSRDTIFDKLGGSQVILSPLGNKMLSVGAMLAAIERSLPVVMVEAIGYEEGSEMNVSSATNGDLKHIWLSGEAYPK